MTAETVRLDQACETPVTARQRGRFGYRYAYARSADSRAGGDPGQDYLVLREDGVRLAFALCDGVGQSFYGDLAARLLGDALVDWLWGGEHFTNPQAFQYGLSTLLDGLVEGASAKVAAYPVPENLPPMLRQVLEEKRALGSESTFVTGLLDTNAGLLYLAWMGDSRLRLWGAEGEFTARLGDNFHTHERWSSRQGRIGNLHAFFLPLSELRYLVAYSDGLKRLDKVMTRHFRDASIMGIIEDALLQPESDDITFLEVWLGDRRPVERPSLSSPPEIRVNAQEGRVRVWWQPVAGTAYYEVRLDNGRSFTVYSPRHALELSVEMLGPAARTVRVRAWDEEPGAWSSEAALPEEVLPRPAPAVAAPVPFLPTPKPAHVPPPPFGPVPPASLRPLVRPGLPSWQHAVPFRLPQVMFLLASLMGVIVCSLLLLLLSSSPVHRLFFHSPTPTPTAKPTTTPTPTATATPTATPTPTSTATPTATFISTAAPITPTATSSPSGNDTLPIVRSSSGNVPHNPADWTDIHIRWGFHPAEFPTRAPQVGEPFLDSGGQLFRSYPRVVLGVQVITTRQQPVHPFQRPIPVINAVWLRPMPPPFPPLPPSGAGRWLSALSRQILASLASSIWVTFWAVQASNVS